LIASDYYIPDGYALAPEITPGNIAAVNGEGNCFDSLPNSIDP
jgi:hypothetical protein